MISKPVGSLREQHQQDGRVRISGTLTLDSALTEVTGNRFRVRLVANPDAGIGDNPDYLICIGALWKRTTRTGQEMLSGPLGNAQLVAFKNRNKQSPEDPDRLIYVATKDAAEPPADTVAPVSDQPDERSDPS